MRINSVISSRVIVGFAPKAGLISETVYFVYRHLLWLFLEGILSRNLKTGQGISAIFANIAEIPVARDDGWLWLVIEWHEEPRPRRR